jgi:hypothetical protein
MIRSHTAKGAVTYRSSTAALSPTHAMIGFATANSDIGSWKELHCVSPLPHVNSSCYFPFSRVSLPTLYTAYSDIVLELLSLRARHSFTLFHSLPYHSALHLVRLETQIIPTFQPPTSDQLQPSRGCEGLPGHPLRHHTLKSQPDRRGVVLTLLTLSLLACLPPSPADTALSK